MPTHSLPASIETARLVLRMPIQDDAESIFDAYAQDIEVCRYMVWQPHADVATTQNFIGACIESANRGEAYPYVITESKTSRVIGMLDARPSNHRVNIGYVLARAFWGKGFMPEAINALTQVALSGAFYRVEATCDIENHASYRTLEKSGFSKEGRLARYTVHPNISAEPRDCWLYARCR
jgi:[ribosomal protein S5]-alanine N-acetyltransferase